MTAISYSNDEQQGDLLLFVYLQPKASRDQIIGLHGNELKIAITAPPIDGKANAHLSKYLAKACKWQKVRCISSKVNIAVISKYKYASRKLFQQK